MINRIYTQILKQHLEKRRQMLFIVGPRQAGKTTLSKMCADFTNNFHYLNWDNTDVKELILNGPTAVSEHCMLNQLHDKKSIIVFDEIHKFPQWKNFLKGFFDTYEDKTKIIVTGSAKLDTYQKGGDSLMGRYIPYHIYPLTAAELARGQRSTELIQPNTMLHKNQFEQLIEFGGFPEPFISKDVNFSQQWQALRQQQVLFEDIQEVSHIRDSANLKLYAELLSYQASQELNFSNVAKKLSVSHESIRSWTKVLNAFYYCFTIQPWHKNISRSILKQPKIYLWDWSGIDDIGAKYENMVALHLRKAVAWYNDLGLSKSELFYIRTKDKEEVDFLMTKNGKPWFLVEVKASIKTPLSKTLIKFHSELKTEHAFQVGFGGKQVDTDIFSISEPTIVPVENLLAQLV